MAWRTGTTMPAVSPSWRRCGTVSARLSTPRPRPRGRRAGPWSRTRCAARSAPSWSRRQPEVARDGDGRRPFCCLPPPARGRGPAWRCAARRLWWPPRVREHLGRHPYGPARRRPPSGRARPPRAWRSPTAVADEGAAGDRGDEGAERDGRSVADRREPAPPRPFAPDLDLAGEGRLAVARPPGPGRLVPGARGRGGFGGPGRAGGGRPRPGGPSPRATPGEAPRPRAPAPRPAPPPPPRGGGAPA